MDKNESDPRLLAQIFGKMMAHEFLLEQIWANALMTAPDPVKTAEEWKDELIDKSENWHGNPGDNSDTAYAIGLYSAEYLANFGKKVLDRITDQTTK